MLVISEGTRTSYAPSSPPPLAAPVNAEKLWVATDVIRAVPENRFLDVYLAEFNKKLSYRRERARQLHTSFSAHSLIVHFTEHLICFTII